MEMISVPRSAGSAAPCPRARRRRSRPATPWGTPRRSTAGRSGQRRTEPVDHLERGPSGGTEHARRATPDRVEVLAAPRHVSVVPGSENSPRWVADRVGDGPVSMVGTIEVVRCTASVGLLRRRARPSVHPAAADARGQVGVLDLLHRQEVRAVRLVHADRVDSSELPAVVEPLQRLHRRVQAEHGVLRDQRRRRDRDRRAGGVVGRVAVRDDQAEPVDAAAG